jgi:endonuclease/exonuclease/phosphatase family metal-dependent hydrolase
MLRRRRWVRPLVALVATGCAGLLLSSVPARPARAATTFVVLQMNLCNSGLAIHTCYSFGRAVDEAVEKIHKYPPELVTLQEICRDDLYSPTGWGKLAKAMADIYGTGHVAVDFVPAVDRDTNDWYRCTDDEPFGNALLYHYPGGAPRSGWYQSQDGTDETRAWTCATVIAKRLTACTTHLSTEPDVASRQCRELRAILAESWVQPEVIVGGDFNLTATPGTHDVRGCGSPGYDQRGDGSLQHVFFSRTVRWTQGFHEPMRFTDHPLLYEKFRV